jgi:PPM family protein phosphatase
MFWNKLFGKKDKNKSTDSHPVTTVGELRVVVLSDLGNIRKNNEDIGMFFRIADSEVALQKGYLLVVADGMGGHEAGEVASRIAAETVSEYYFNTEASLSIEKSLTKSLAAANKRIYNMSAANKMYKGMGTTCTCVAVVGDAIYFGHVGDSRAYLIKANQSIEQITTDHTYVQELVKNGEISIEEAAHHPKRNILTNAMGTKPDTMIDTGMHQTKLGEGDRILLCSDGLYEYVKDDEMVSILLNRNLHEAAAIFIQEAKKRGGHDNITVVLAERQNKEEQPEDGRTAQKETGDFEIPTTREIELP